MLAHGLGRPRTLVGLGLVLVASTAITAQACRKVPLLAPSGSAIFLTVSTNTLAIDGAAEITAFVLEGAFSVGTGGANTSEGGGQPVHNGTVVTFTTSLGRLEPGEAKTSNGRAVVRLIGDGRSGTATVTAYSGAATETVTIPVGTAAVERLTLTASPQSVPGTGGSVQISARVEDEGGNLLSGVPVSFTTPVGSLSDAVVRSNAQGIATTTLTTTQQAEVTATAGAATATVTVAVRPITSVAIVLPSSGSATVGVPAVLTIRPSAGAGLVNVNVDFGDGTDTDLGAISGDTTVPHPFRFAGITTITARATDGSGTVTTTSAQLAVAPLNVTLAVSPSQARFGALVQFTATVSPGAIIERYDWDFGDGRVASTASNQVATTYVLYGEIVVKVRAIPIGGGTPGAAQLVLSVIP
jgi:adhesin/invasin